MVRYYQAWAESGAGLEDAAAEGEDESESDEAGWLSSTPSPAPRTPRGGKVLFIQMEYCRTTLREVLDGAGPLGEEEAWWFTRQARRTEPEPLPLAAAPTRETAPQAV